MLEVFFSISIYNEALWVTYVVIHIHMSFPKITWNNGAYSVYKILENVDEKMHGLLYENKRYCGERLLPKQLTPLVPITFIQRK